MSDAPGAGSAPVDPVEPQIRFISGNPDADEIAAVTAVLTAALEELAAERGARRETGPSAWERSQKALRTPVHPANGAWRSFSA